MALYAFKSNKSCLFSLIFNQLMLKLKLKERVFEFLKQSFTACFSH